MEGFGKRRMGSFSIGAKNYWNQKKNVLKSDVKIFVKNFLNSFFKEENYFQNINRGTGL